MFKYLLNQFVKNFRMGLATNSSSSHSLVYFKRPRHAVPAEVEGEMGWEENEAPTIQRIYDMDVEFGWGQFRLDTLYEKLMYALVNRLQKAGYTDSWGSDDKPEEGFAEFGHLFPELSMEDFRVAARGYIDHQSFDHVGSDPDYVLNAARNPNVEIWGGNDNDGDPHEDYLGWDSPKPEVLPEGMEKVEYL